ncbi:MAG: hypothetical protein JNN20_00075 [Betaproteobacteria bacterium]|nr:hypothetical protein [Betaproteobacteria bacterium]
MPLFLRILVIVCLLGFGYHWWGQRSERLAITRAMDQNGFLPIPMPAGAEPGTVLIFAPVNCTKEAAQRAAVLSERLTSAGIPNLRTSQYGAQTFTPTEENHKAFKRLDIVMRGEIPIALVNGMGKANPTADEVIAVYKRTKTPG